MSKLELYNIYAGYEESKPVLKDISFFVEKGEFIVLLGTSGCGKTTILNLIAGMIPISAGELYIDGVKSNDTPPRKRNIFKKKGNIDPADADKKYQLLVKKHKEISKELKSLEEQRSLKAASACRVKMHIKALKENQIPLDEFQIKWWSLLLEKAVVHRDNRIEFIYYSGYKNEIAIH